MSAHLYFLAKDASDCLAEALKYEAMTAEYPHMQVAAERRAQTAQDRIDTLVYYAKTLEDRIAAAEAKLADAIDAENV